MATERRSPDGAIFVLTCLAGAYTDVDDDPDSPDGLWLIADGNNVDTAVRASFPSPTENPTVGADLQEFRVLVRQYDEGQSGEPKARIELWEDGSLVRAGTDTAVPIGGTVLSFKWNANELGTADGSLVECKVVGTAVGGAPTKRNTVEVGAIEWNVTYSRAVAKNWQSEGPLVVCTIGAGGKYHRVQSLVLGTDELSGSVITITLEMEVDGIIDTVYSQGFNRSSGNALPGLWVINGTLGIHEALVVKLKSNNAADNGKSVRYDYSLELAGSE